MSGIFMVHVVSAHGGIHLGFSLILREDGAWSPCLALYLFGIDVYVGWQDVMDYDGKRHRVMVNWKGLR